MTLLQSNQISINMLVYRYTLPAMYSIQTVNCPINFRGRDRYVSDEFDLDLTYITERIIAMSFPATGMESTYRNSLKDVAKMLEIKHQENYMVRSRTLTKTQYYIFSLLFADI